MSTSQSSSTEYITSHPLTWSSNALQSLNVAIVDSPPGFPGLRGLPVHRALASTVSINAVFLSFVGKGYSVPKYWGFGSFLQECLTSIKTANRKRVDISYSTEPLELQQGIRRATLPISTFVLRGIPFLVYVEPYEVEQECIRLGSSNTSTFDIMSFYFAVLIALAQKADNMLQQKRDAYPVTILRSPISHFRSADIVRRNLLIPATTARNLLSLLRLFRLQSSRASKSAALYPIA